VPQKEKFVVNFRNTLLPVRTSDVAYFVKDELIYLCTFENQRHILDYPTLEEIEELLNSSTFYRANRQYIINEKAMLAMGLTRHNVIGTKLEMWNGKGEIIGLTNNFVNGNLHQGVEPLILMFTTNNGSNYYIKTIENANVNQMLASIAAVTKKYSPEYPFEYSFLDSDYGKEYKTESVLGKLSFGFTLVAVIICCLGLFGLATFAAEQRIGTLSTVFALLAIFISCLGIFGLASFVAAQRIKEIGVRKILGASVMNLWGLLSR
jgi:ABC-type antimicrobial peptide transport system permease subunit